MNNELVEQLRLHARASDSGVLLSGAPYAEAADEIERLRVAIFDYVNEKHNDALWAHGGRAHKEQRESSAVRVANAYAELVEIYRQAGGR